MAFIDRAMKRARSPSSPRGAGDREDLPQIVDLLASPVRWPGLHPRARGLASCVCPSPSLAGRRRPLAGTRRDPSSARRCARRVREAHPEPRHLISFAVNRCQAAVRIRPGVLTRAGPSSYGGHGARIGAEQSLPDGTVAPPRRGFAWGDHRGTPYSNRGDRHDFRPAMAALNSFHRRRGGGGVAWSCGGHGGRGPEAGRDHPGGHAGRAPDARSALDDGRQHRGHRRPHLRGPLHPGRHEPADPDAGREPHGQP